ncbi:MAG: NADPH-dependent oxidoreductase [Planctomycetota bacterium]|nr:NADPH-dependent oxidoreductase [Planctomycetota bacterium]
MNPTIDLLNAHRSVRAFAAKPVPTDHLRAAIGAGQMASTSSAVQSYCAINITDADTRREIAELSGGQAYVESAPLFLLFCADSRRHRIACEESNTAYNTRLEAFLVGAIDVALFAQNVAVAFESLGYGICFIGGIRNDLPRLDALLDIPDGVYPLYGMCVGTPAHPQPSPLRPRLPLESVLMHGRYQNDDTMREHLHAYDETYRDYLRARGEPEHQVAQAWTERMAKYYGNPRRKDVAAYFASKGAGLD